MEVNVPGAPFLHRQCFISVLVAAVVQHTLLVRKLEVLRA